MPTNDELEKAFRDGQEHHSRGIGSHTADGKHLSPHVRQRYHEGQRELLAAWLAGYDRARKAVQ